MTTSAETIYETTRDKIIEGALRKIGALAKGQDPDAEDLSNGQDALNALMAEFQTFGMPMWKRTQYTLTTVANENTYYFGIGEIQDTPFPLKIDSAVLRNSDGAAQEMLDVSRADFNLLNSESTGKPIQYTYQQRINNGILKLWPMPDAAYAIELTYRTTVEGFTGAAETPDFPQEWTNALIYGLAVLLAPEYGVPLADQQMLQKQADAHLTVAKDFDYENSSFFVYPAWRY